MRKDFGTGSKEYFESKYVPITIDLSAHGFSQLFRSEDGSVCQIVCVQIKPVSHVIPATSMNT